MTYLPWDFSSAERNSRPRYLSGCLRKELCRIGAKPPVQATILPLVDANDEGLFASRTGKS